MNFRKVNNLTGWVVFAIATLTYSLTREARGSLWDCGEFVATAYKLQMAHPPGAPMFSLLGRIFILLFGDNPQTAANAVNFMSALVSAATILFLFWTITHFARKMFAGSGESLTGQQIFTVMTAGTVGALAYTFTDSFWYSAVEGEVYALSSFFTGLVFWAMLKWEHADELAGADEDARARSDRWIVFLFFMMGLSIGVHLLNLLTIPAIVMIYYYRRYTPSVKGSVAAFLIGCAITGIIQVAIIQYSMKAAGLFDIMFVNSFGMPFFSGFTVYFILIALLVAIGLRFKPGVSKTAIILWTAGFFLLAFLPFAFGGTMAAVKIILLLIVGAVLGYFIRPTALKIMKLFLWCFSFMMLGYFMYFTNIIRSSANPAIDMNNVDNPINLVYYLSREQYGTQPLFYGAHYAAEVDYDENGSPYDQGEMKYVKGENKYIPIGRDRSVRYKSSDKQLFVRIWDSSNEQGHADFYADWLGLAKPDPNTGQGSYGAPSYADNINWFMSYQTSFMYMRYFMWNFAGKQNDLQGYGNKRDGNWISGISIMDNARLGDQGQLPESLKQNKAHNVLYMLPFVLGIIGFVYQFLKNRKDWVVTFLLFFFTGMAIVLYLNQPGNQPRERDYAYVGSFYAFAIWIGLSVVALLRSALEKEDKESFQKLLVYGASGTFLITALSSMSSTFGAIIIASLGAAVIYAAVVYIVAFAARALSSGGSNIRTANVLIALLCLAVPGLMAQQGWNDHDRSEKTMAPDLAKDYLESCAPNAILFTFGDNDTYPLWYAQEVENIRPDIRIINTSLLGIDWYINQLRYKINDADSVDVILSPEQIEGHNREYLAFRQPQPGQNIDPNNVYPLYDVIKTFIGARTEDPETGRDVGSPILPFRKFFVPVNKDIVHKNGTANPTDSVPDQWAFEIPASRSGIQRNDLMVLSIIASNQWKRPVYFTAPYGELGFGQNLRKDGLTYRLVPFTVKAPQANWIVDQAYRQMRAGGTSIRDNNEDVMAKNLLTKFEFGGANKKGVYFDEVNRQYLLNIRSIFAEAAGNLADAGKKEEAVKLLNKAEAGILPENLPYAMTSRYNQHNQTGLMYAEAFYKAGKLDMARKVIASIKKDLADQRKYYNYLKAEKPEYFQGLANIEDPLNEITQAAAEAIESHYDPLKKGEKTPVQELMPQENAPAKAADSAGKSAASDTSKK
ncbi:DUF2723 domain-containing protein [Niabella sp. CC-SYL272]|uniref:glycosyltransferase family 117 protein n=1 Tax=Niabella agricola TaxID=2891571 RepID=UPI001F25EB6F|nr:DUF2723 domain-containing protein [Niabella agricola]MCF3107174.1 DUF2723 domain-containing protein [Niabella agricola]